jgi:hypothetical protein
MWLKDVGNDKSFRAGRMPNGVKFLDPVRGKPCRSGQGQERGRQSRSGGLDWF